MRWAKIVASVVLVLLAVAGGTLAASSYGLSWWTVDAGGGTFSSGGGYALGGTVGQPDAGQMSGGGYTLGGGFWGGGVVAVEREVYLPLVLRG